MPSHLTARQFGEKVNLEHKEIIRRIRKGQIKAGKFGWNWAIPSSEVEAVREADWYKNVMKRRGIEIAST